MKLSISLALVALSFAAAPLIAYSDDANSGTQTTTTTDTTTNTNTNNSNNMTLDSFQRAEALNKIHHINQKEIKLSKLAQDKSPTASVKQFAQQMIDDHTKADQKVQDLAKKENVDLKSFQAADFEQTAMDNLDKLNGTQFDTAFTNMMRMGHHEALEYLQHVQAHSKDTQLKSLVTQLIPTVRAHERTAMNLKTGKSQMAGEANQ